MPHGRVMKWLSFYDASAGHCYCRCKLAGISSLLYTDRIVCTTPHKIQLHLCDDFDLDGQWNSASTIPSSSLSCTTSVCNVTSPAASNTMPLHLFAHTIGHAMTCITNAAAHSKLP